MCPKAKSRPSSGWRLCPRSSTHSTRDSSVSSIASRGKWMVRVPLASGGTQNSSAPWRGRHRTDPPFSPRNATHACGNTSRSAIGLGWIRARDRVAADAAPRGGPRVRVAEGAPGGQALPGGQRVQCAGSEHGLRQADNRATGAAFGVDPRPASWAPG